MKLNILELDEFITLNKLEIPDPKKFNKLVNDLSFYKNEINEIENGNYERGILLYSLIKKFKPKNILEFGTAHGFGTSSMSYAINENNNDAKIYTIDYLTHNEPIKHVRMIENEAKDEITTRKKLLTETIPKEWLDSITFLEGYSGQIYRNHNIPKIDFFYIDASHFYEAVKHDFFISILLSNSSSIFVLDDYIDIQDFGIKKLIDNELSKYIEITLVKTDKRSNSEIIINNTKTDFGMCFFKIEQKKILEIFEEEEINLFLKKYKNFERRYEIRKKLNKRIPFLEKIRFGRF
jgi:predicted O-methyltransferase YrrM